MKFHQHIFVVECNKTSKSDWYYIRKLLTSSYFSIDLQTTPLHPVFMDGKTNYASEDVKNEINSLIQAFPERSSVHFVFDVDRGLTKDKKLNEKIIAYLSGQVFAKGIVPDIIWFNKNIECVLLGHSVSDNKKAETARNFYTQGHCELDEAHMEALHYEGFPKIDTSNILVVLYSQLPIGKKAKPLIKTNEKNKKN